jgi:hypothetical protein
MTTWAWRSCSCKCRAATPVPFLSGPRCCRWTASITAA